MLQNYELYIIFNPELSSEEIQKEQDTINSILTTDLKAQNLDVQSEGLRKLAYPISKHRTGFYSLANFDIDMSDARNLKNLEKKLNLSENVIRYIIINQTDYLKQKSKEKRNDVEIVNHRELNKGKSKAKKCISKYMGLKVVDYKDVSYLSQFVSPYSKIFIREKTGSSAKFQRKITQAVKRARHMALMSFTPIHNDQ